ncbi:unnamed protein product [Calicophoron daubneyi]|uniref:Uncharacterized protein n=1 Tax=Calicophoron daubneyi TaxID=300641 RepID=A0AAV2TSL3_CALDB
MNPMRMLVFASICCIGFLVSKRFVPALVLPYLFCKAVEGSRNRSLLLCSTIGGVLFAEISTLFSTIPSLCLRNVLHLFLVHCFLGHYFLWCLLEFDMLDIEHELLNIPMHSSFPAVCCLVFSTSVSVITSWPLSFVICISGFIILGLCCRYQPSQRLDELWTSLMDVCSAVLLIIIPLVSNFIDAKTNMADGSASSLTGSIFLFSISCYMFILLPYNGYIQISGSAHRWILAFTSLVFGLLLYMQCFLSPEARSILTDKLAWISVQLVSFCSILLLALNAYSKSAAVRHFSLSLSLLAAFILSVGYLSFLRQSLTMIETPILDASFTTRTLFTLAVCILSALSTILAYARSAQCFELFLALFLCTFQMCEWQLYQSLLITDYYFLGSSFIMLVAAFMYHIKTSADQENLNVKNQSIEIELDACLRHIFSPCILAPALTKLTLVFLSKSTGSDLLAVLMSSSVRDQPTFRTRYLKRSTMGVYLTYLGLTCGSRIIGLGLSAFTFLQTKIARPVLRSNLVRTVSGVIIMLGFFICSLIMAWPALTNLIIDSHSRCRGVIVPLAFLLTGLSLQMPSVVGLKINNLQVNKHRLHSCSSACIQLGTLVLWTAVLTHRVFLMPFWFILPTVATPLCLAIILWLTVRLISVGSPLIIRSSRCWSFFSWLITSVRWGTIQGLITSTALLYLTSMKLDWICFSSICLYNACLSGLIIWPTNTEIDPSEGDTESVQISFKSNDSSKDSVPLSDPEMNVTPSRYNAALKMTEETIRLKLLLLFLGCASASLVVGLLFLRMKQSGIASTTSCCPLAGTLAVAIFLLGQVAAGHPTLASFIMETSRSEGMQSSRNSIPSGEHAVLNWCVNITVIIAILLFVFGCSWNLSDLQVLFLPCFLFGLCGKRCAERRLLAPLLGFTIIILASVFSHSHFMMSSNPPLPTFSRSLFRTSHSRWLCWSELMLTLLLIPVHFIFLADQARLHSSDLLSFLLPRYVFKFVLSEPVRLQAAHLLSQFFAFVLCCVHALLFCCLGYLIFASSFFSALFGFYSFFVCTYLLLRVDIITS